MNQSTIFRILATVVLVLSVSRANSITNFSLNELGLNMTEVDDGTIKLADEEHHKESFSGLGRISLQKNIIGGVNVLTQDMLSKANTIYVIQYDYDLKGAEITIPKGCVLDFQGGSISNGSITFQNTQIKSNSTAFYNLNIRGSVKDNTINDFYFSTIDEAFVNGYNVGATVVFNNNHKIGGDVLSEIVIPSIKGNGFLLETENITFLSDNNSISVSDITISSNIYADIDNAFPKNTGYLIKASNAKNVYLNNIILKQAESSSLYRTLGLVKFTSCSNIILTNIITLGSHLPFRFEYCDNINADNIKISNYETGFWLTECNDVSITNINAKNNPDTEYNWWIGCNSTTMNNGKDTFLASGRNYYISNVVSYYPIERTGYLNISDSVVENITSYNGTVKVSGHEDYIVENVQVSNIRTIHNKPTRNRNVSMVTRPTYEGAFTTYYSKNIKVKDVYWDLCEGVDYVAGAVIHISDLVENIDISNIYATNSANKDVYGFLSMGTSEGSSNVCISNIYLKNIGKKLRYSTYSSMIKATSDLTIDNLNVLYDKTQYLASDLIDTSIWEDLTYTPYIVIKNSNIALYANITDAISNGIYNSFPCALVNTTLNFYPDYGAKAAFKDIITSFFNTIKIQSAFNLTINYKGKTAFSAKVRDLYYINGHDYNTSKTLYNISDAISDFEVIPNN